MSLCIDLMISNPNSPLLLRSDGIAVQIGSSLFEMMQDFKLKLVFSETQLPKLSDTNCNPFVQEYLNLQMGVIKSEYYLHQCETSCIFASEAGSIHYRGRETEKKPSGLAIAKKMIISHHLMTQCI